MSLTRKQRRERAAKEARTIKPEAVAGVNTPEMELRTAYRQVEELEGDKAVLSDKLKSLGDAYDELEDVSHTEIERLHKAAFAWAVGLMVLGYVLGLGTPLLHAV